MKEFTNKYTVPYCFGQQFKAPAGYVFKLGENGPLFREPEAYEAFLNGQNSELSCHPRSHSVVFGPRLILEEEISPKAAPKVTEPLFKHKPTVAFKYLRTDHTIFANEWYINTEETFIKRTSMYKFQNSFDIYERIEL